MRSPSQAGRFGVALVVLFLSAAGLAAAGDAREPEPFRAIRAQDQLILKVGPGFLTFDEKIVMKPLGRRENLPPGRPNLLYVLIPALWIREGAVQRPAFSTLRPYFQSTHGRVQRFALLKPDGDRVLSIDQMTPECRYVLTLEFGHVIPDEFTVTVGFASTGTIDPSVEFLYNPSNDGYAVRSGPTESVVTELRLNADPPYAPWKVFQGDNVLARHTPYAVRLTRELNHVIRFAQE